MCFTGRAFHGTRVPRHTWVAGARRDKGFVLSLIHIFLVPKLLHPRLRNHADQMSALGESIAPNGARVPSVESGDIDQHQLDAGPVLGGSTAGMFIRLAAWRQLGGLDPAIPLYRDGVDFGWRALEAGLVVRSCPQAAFRHREAGRVGLRDSQVAPNAQIADAVAGMRVASAHSPHPGRTSRAITASSWGTALALSLIHI